MIDTNDIKAYYSIDDQYIEELYLLQVELLKLQKHIQESSSRLLIIFEGRDTAGKGRAIFRFTQFMNPQNYRTVALGKPTEIEIKQWYFLRYLSKLPNPGEIVFFDRSWYNRAIVEPVMGFCTKEQYMLFMEQVIQVEKLLIDDGIRIIKFWFSIDSEEQEKRIKKRIDSPLMKWKVSPVDLVAKEKFEEFTAYKVKMLHATSTEKSPWVVIKSEDREDSRVQAMRYVLTSMTYPDKSHVIQIPDKGKIQIFGL